MRLSTIKLSGFKSFVDPTTLHLPTNMTGIVGPNGCGKSNIIDAVRWVMGESSASRLRGDSLTDVIFSGSSTRKPVSQATVELIFDNSDGAVGGEYARFNEISVKRVVSRDGQSSYFLNNARCRRRDITDLFLGTGLGPRSYSIIEQGMISQIIEARPEDLRVYLEEAAGISKYKERRKETETRIRHTRENLDRLNDLREEIDKQLEHLKRQARAAELYQQYQAERREKDAQLKALEYRRLDGQLAALRETLAQDETRLEQLIAEQRHAEAQIEICRAQHGEASERLAQVQAEVYRIGGDIARVEQQIQHQRELYQRLERARIEADAAWAEIGEHIEADERQLEELRLAIAEAEPRLEALQSEDGERQEALRSTEAALADWQLRWDAYAKSHAEASRAAEVERTKIEYLERQALEAGRRREALASERGGLDVTTLGQALEEMRLRHEEQKASLDALGEQLEQRKRAVAALQEQQRQAQAELAETRKQGQAARGRLGSLEALQHAALGQEKGAALEWLRQHGLENAARLGETLEVEAGWETAVETVLGALLEAVTVDAPERLFESLAQFANGRVALVAADTAPVEVAPDSLAARLRGPAAIRRLLKNVLVAEDLAAAKARLPALADGQAIVTRAGEWIGPGWVRVLRSGEAQQGALAREREIHALREEIDTLARREHELNEQLALLRDRILEAEQQREDAQRSLYLAHRGVSELAGQIQSQQGRLESAQGRLARIEQELAQLAQTLQESQARASEARGGLERALSAMGELESQRAALESERRLLIDRRDAARNAAREVRETAHQLALTLESKRTRVVSLTQALARMGSQRSQLESRRSELAAQLADGDAPIRQLEAERQAYLDQRVVVERDLAAARSAVDGIEDEMRRYEQTRQQRDQQALAQRETISRKRLEEQALALKAQQLEEGIAAAGMTLDAVLSALPPEADFDAWQKALADLEARIRRLEPVNLAAIQEYGEQSQRKTYLDSQHADLTSALETLEDAIRKIDRETRGRFKDTFDRVNAGVQELFPRLFGGGHAYLELTGEDLLDTGVAIMARPPGKRPSNISLLSGGEKALTAVALVFAIFRLNPAPFCLLDEVDAPLDEANVGRFCAMVSEMSEKVQFLFVTHNKATMEAARQLCGVTMREPGVSRLVSVDLAEASRLAGAA
ncbi:chromosome segregation protein SMC [Rehaibacterium terrae]|jgi:chromosome segregation protein|uniref:Chromosome partition protein Smc n=1 Tax=Rehaibacterium terrae TaxID=1341696 RepID=A0A7W7XXN0_9GAMM|nr:chromosome segregation protein SMC [Rehaibacterium terrae]MBB5014346.1 chromosome segregation protein [Rehaibacterium terrae]